MKNNPKILIIGFGSIGQRHYRNLQKLGFENIYVFDIAGVKDKNVKTVGDISQPILKLFKVVFVCNPNNMHMKTALSAAKVGCHLFIEKPLSHNSRDIQKLEEIVKKNKLIDMVACNMRFHPAIKFIKNYIANKKLGKIYSISHDCGWYLPYWRPNQDYRKNYAAKRSMGGGIILDDIHEFDLLFWFNDFVKVKESKFIYNKVSDLKIQTEDNCLAIFKFFNKVLGVVKCDYLQQSYTRTCKVVGEKGNLEWNFKENIVWLKTNRENKKLFAVKNYDLNGMYIDEIKYFFSCVDKKKRTFNDMATSKIVLKYCVEKR